MLRILCFIFITSLLFVGCAKKEVKSELSFIKQDLGQFAESWMVDSNKTLELKEKYLDSYFSPFDLKVKHNKDELLWGIKAAFSNPGFGENLEPYSLDEIKKLESVANLESYPSVKIPAVIVNNANLRVLPTNKPRFIKGAGEGYPFDLWQNSSIYANTPVLITHYSKNKEWAFVESGFVSGWVESKSVGILSKKAMKQFRKRSDFIVFLQDFTPLFLNNGEFLEMGRVGMLLPLVEKNGDFYEAFSFIRDEFGKAKAVRVKVGIKNATEFPQSFFTKAVASLAQGILGEKYGWGGLYGNRDCSSLLRDIFSNFGFYLPRNSQAQMGVNRELSEFYLPLETLPLDKLESLSDSKKAEFLERFAKDKKGQISDFAIPFATLLGLKGHIMLYLGEIDGEIYVLHDVWGLKTLQNETKEGRKIIGKVAITSLEIGKGVEEVVQENLLIYRIYGARNLVLKTDLKEAEQH
ncbi:MAG: SH3 domain-containing protein [Helicobacter sp.]|nr:SH3 domain-containing protein [Helicobacter sp.]